MWCSCCPQWHCTLTTRVLLELWFGQREDAFAVGLWSRAAGVLLSGCPRRARSALGCGYPASWHRLRFPSLSLEIKHGVASSSSLQSEAGFVPQVVTGTAVRLRKSGVFLVVRNIWKKVL